MFHIWVKGVHDSNTAFEERQFQFFLRTDFN